jgi:endonuclease/exonuclease/phosphatase family metal-dependent hydrolase
VLAALASALTFAVGVAACSSEDAPATREESEELAFEILYAGADGTEALRGRERLEALPAQVAHAPADVLCLQGVAAPSDRANLKTALASTYSFSLDLPTDDESKVDDPRDATGVVPPQHDKPPCKDLEPAMTRVLSCLAGCVKPPGFAIFHESCLTNDPCAPDTLFTADPERRCRSCIFGHARTGSPLLETAKRCAEAVHPLSLRGQHGMMILSRFPLSRPSIRVLPSEGTRRAVIGATLTTPRHAEVDVFCATLGPTEESGLPTDPRVTEPYPGPYGAPRDGWLRENELQIDKLSSYVTAQRGARAAIVLGDFGVSAEISRNGSVSLPATGAIGAARLEHAFVDAVAPSYTPGCTVCRQNPLAPEGAPTFRNRIYLAGLDASAVRASTRSYLGEVVSLGPNLTPARVPLSMQYGFRSRIAVPSR